MKDLFSTMSGEYARFRPTYPDELFAYLNSIVPARADAWDCATGNGQVAARLAEFFERVFGTDISKEQLAQAAKKSNLTYLVTPAESTPFGDNAFDLVTVAQAIHWFNFDRFYAEVKRTLRRDGILAVIGYPAPEIDPGIDELVEEYRTDVVGPYWDPERRYVDEWYRTIPFPFEEISAPRYAFSFDWSAQQLCGYLATWSAAGHYREKRGADPVDVIRDRLLKRWGGELRRVTFPLILRVGRKTS